jgi:hypothetical protein
MKASAKAPACLDFRGRIGALLDLAEKRPGMFASPRWLELRLCAFLAAWEAVTLHPGQARRWQALWLDACRKLHHGRTDLTLADPVGGPDRRQRPGVPVAETGKAYSRVLEGLRRVYRGVVEQDKVNGAVAPTLQAQSAGALAELIAEAFRHGKSLADPEGLESYLLTLIELFECARGKAASATRSGELWQREIRRRRSVGPPETRTLADVTSLDKRLERAKAFPPEERKAVVARLIKAMRRVVQRLDTYLAGQRPTVGTGS